MDEREKILELGEEKFFREGFYKTTMDTVASDLRMSKKTIYKYFPSKEQLVRDVAFHFMKKMRGKIIPALEGDKNAIEKLSELLKILTKASDRLSPRLFDELRRHFPDIWNEMDEFRAQMMLGNITKVINQGKEEGHFMDYPTPVIMTMLIASVRAVVNPDFILDNNFSMKEAAQSCFRIIMRGILTEKGKKEYLKIYKESI